MCVQDNGIVLNPLQNFKQNTVNIQAGFELGGVEALQTKFLKQSSDCSLDFSKEVKCLQVTTRRQAKLQINIESNAKLAWRKSDS